MLLCSVISKIEGKQIQYSLCFYFLWFGAQTLLDYFDSKYTFYLPGSFSDVCIEKKLYHLVIASDWLLLLCSWKFALPSFLSFSFLFYGQEYARAKHYLHNMFIPLIHAQQYHEPYVCKQKTLTLQQIIDKFSSPTPTYTCKGVIASSTLLMTSTTCTAATADIVYKADINLFINSTTLEVTKI